MLDFIYFSEKISDNQLFPQGRWNYCFKNNNF